LTILFSGFPFDFAQGGESFDLAQDRELVERPVEPRISPVLCGLVRNDEPGMRGTRVSLLLS
jgi:hypothetical protein